MPFESLRLRTTTVRVVTAPMRANLLRAGAAALLLVVQPVRGGLKPTCAVLDFETLEGLTEGQARMISARISAEFALSGDYLMIERHQVQRVLEENEFGMICSETACAVEAGRFLAASHVVIGTVGKFGSLYAINTRLVSVETGVVRAQATTDHEGRLEDLLRVAAVASARTLLGRRPAEAAGGEALERRRLPLGGGVSLELVHVPAGSFIMGTNTGDGDAQPAHEVTIARPFWIGVTEVTRRQYRAVMGVAAPREASGFPVSVSWQDAEAFCRKLTALAAGAGNGLGVCRLPREQEWEYACRGGTEGRFFFTGGLTALGDYAWYAANSGCRPRAAGMLEPNPWGLRDILGNAWEWCEDWYDAYPGAQRRNEFMGTQRRVLRGGSCLSNTRLLSSYGRSGDVPTASDPTTGFRVVAEQP